MKIQVIHDKAGQILGVLHIEPVPPGDKLNVQAGIYPNRGQFVLELDAPPDFAKRPFYEIGERYTVDVAGKKLVPRDTSGKC